MPETGSAAAASSPVRGPTLRARLERQRLEHRRRQAERVLKALRDRAVFRLGADGTVPRALEQAIDGFTRELATIKGRLRELPPS